MSFEPDERLQERRSALRLALEETQDGIRRTFGLRVSERSWLLPLLSAAVGVTVGLAVRRRRRKRALDRSSS